MHPASKILSKKSQILVGKKVILGITGSMALIESVRLCRELIRFGANVQVIMTEDAKKLVDPSLFEFASGNEVITNIDGKVQHITIMEDSDLFLIAPATANTISKIASGIGDTPVTLCALNAFTFLPIVIVPSMNEDMYKNPIIKENIEKLSSLGLHIINPRIEDGKAKMPSQDSIVAHVIRQINSKIQKKVLIIGGASAENIDDFRVITNKSSGETSIEIAKNAFFYGADVKLLMGKHSFLIPEYLNYESFESVSDLIKKIDVFLNYDVIIVPAALCDFGVEKREGKIKSDKDLTLHLRKNDKFIKKLREKYNGCIIAFKAEYDLNKDDLIELGKKKREEYDVDILVANDIKEVKNKETEAYIISKDGLIKETHCKSDLGKSLIEIISSIKQ